MGSKLFKEKEEPSRVVVANDRVGTGMKFCDNKISNTKYSILSFLPKNLYIQFKAHMNRYFLLIACLQLWSEVTPVNPVTTWLPLIAAVGLTAIKEGVDDFFRWRRDRTANLRQYQVVVDGELRPVNSQDIRVGDVLYITDGEEFPCDLVLLASSDANGVAYIQTANLDGEIDLKSRQSPVALMSLMNEQGVDAIKKFNGTIECAGPNRHIYQFDSSMKLNGSDRTIPLSADQLLLQSTNLKNTDWVYGVAVYTGNQTKCGKNKQLPPTKKATADKIIDRIAMFIFIFQLSIMIAFGVAGTVVYYSTDQQTWYLKYPVMLERTWYDPIIIPLRFLLLCSYMVPISLKFTIDLMKYAFALLIFWDNEMYDEESESYATAANSSISEDLGQVQYILTDKTGTLTENKMIFKKCSIAGIVYDGFDDSRLTNAVSQRQEAELAFFKNLALCNTAVPKLVNEAIVYQSSSPDEEALVKAAAHANVRLVDRTATSMTIEVLGTREEYDILHICGFTSDRKRMGVVIRDKASGRVMIYIKGADDVMLPRLRDDASVAPTKSHLEAFASTGLRTLIVGCRELTQDECNDWLSRVEQAASALQNREQALSAVYETIETDLTLMGATAIEDKLQDGVPETISKLREAGIKIWMLTGDKFATANQIGLSCNLVDHDRPLLAIEGEDRESVRTSFEKALTLLVETYPAADKSTRLYSIIITGASLHIALDHFPEEFSDLAFGAKTVICCRVTPSQKAEIVGKVKKTGAKTLSIGDGGNDVPMIQEADIGVGIAGKEGLQASRAADYSFAKFRFLIPLLFVHGHYSLHRTAVICQFSYYKNIVLALCQIMYNIYAWVSGNTPYNSISLTLFNFIWTGIYVFCFVFDRDVSKDVLLNTPRLYKHTQAGVPLNALSFVGWFLRALFHAGVVFYGTVYICENHVLVASAMDKEAFGTLLFTACLFALTFNFAMETSSFTVINHIVVWGILVAYIIFSFVYTMLPMFDNFRVFLNLLSDPIFYLTVILIMLTSMIPVMVWKAAKILLKPNELELFKYDHLVLGLHKEKAIREKPSFLSDDSSNFDASSSQVELKNATSIRIEA